MMAVVQVWYAPIVQWFRTSLFQGGSGDSTSPGGRVLRKEVDHGLSISLEFFLLGSMPERLMGTDCKFVGNMSTLVQIQLGPKIRRSTWKWYHITHLVLPRNARSPNTEEKFSSLIYLYHYLFTLFFQQIRILIMIQIHIRIGKYKVKSKEKGK